MAAATTPMRACFPWGRAVAVLVAHRTALRVTRSARDEHLVKSRGAAQIGRTRRHSRLVRIQCATAAISAHVTRSTAEDIDCARNYFGASV